jgi:hypothetical protein
LEVWIGASRQDSLPRGANEYLFSTLGQSPPLGFTTMGRRTLLVLGGGIALLLGLALLHIAALRRAETLLVAAVLIVALGFALPDAAALVGQTAVLGLAVAAVVGIWIWMASGRAPGTRPAAPLSAPAARPPSEIRSTEAPHVRDERTPLRDERTPTLAAAGASLGESSR